MSLLKNLKKLKTFRMSCGKKLKFDFDKNAQNLIKNLRYLDKVEDFELDISDKLSEACFQELMETSMSGLGHLEQLKLHAPKTVFTHKSWVEERVRTTTHLKKMECVLKQWELRI
jgi:uncharacterized protein YicC (UPF0701 family)